MPRLAVVVVGQSPRPDAEAELRAVLGPEIAIDLVGAVDGLDRAEIERHKPEGSHETLFTILADGRPVILSKRLVEERAAERLEAAAATRPDAALLFCTGEFPHLAARSRIVFPSLVLTHLVRALLPRGRLGVFTPLPEQERQVRDKWAESGLDVSVEAIVPVAGAAEVDAAATRMAAHRPDLVVLDCMSYTQATKVRVRARCPVPGILAVSAAARAVGEMLA